ncbi:uncharacterized protein Gp150 isoform X2 [Chelonus insularis]|uniref:uncharacterized protein Gp150 isoform X2 n=1 Tax=Chelonus insularis TaxID=460826 RepID=UPI00158CEF15|nr:uncharacterized protein LOC118072303 isoform X2 [Chelonus insularis]
MKRHGRLALLLPLSVLLITATTIHASPTSHRPDEKTTEVEHETTSTTTKTTWKSVSTTERPTNQPEVTSTTAAPLGWVSFEETEKPKDDAKELLFSKNDRLKEILKLDEKTSSEDLSRLTKPIINPKDALLQEIQTLDETESNNQIQEEVAKVIKAEAQRTRPKKRLNNPITLSTTSVPPSSQPVSTTESRAMKELLEAETDVTYNDMADDDDEDDDEDDDSDEDDDDDDDDDDEYNDDDIDDEEDVMTNCPDYCRCSGQFTSATTARCSKLVEKQSFGPGITHLLIENAGEIRLGPHALRTRNLEHLETITIVDTRIAGIDRTAFDGITYLFAVNLSRTNLFDIHPDTFQNNSQLNLLTIAGHPLHNWNTDYLLDAPSVSEFDFSWNSLPQLPKSAFSKMPNLAYLNLKQNQLKRVEKHLFKPLTALAELDLSGNLLSDLPVDVFENTDLQRLNLAGNFLTTLASITAASLNILDVSNNRIKVIAKSDLDNVPLLEQLHVSGNNMKRIHQHAFSELDQLEYVDISNNKISSLTEHHFRNNPRLEVLRMNDNPELGSLPIFKITGLEYNTYNIYRLECSNCGLQFIKSGTFNAMPALIHLNLAKNKLTGLPKGLLEPLSTLRELDLSDNMISSIPTHMFYGAKSLTKLNLAGNPLVTLQVTPFMQIPELSRLDVDRCQLRRIWSEARQPLKSLRFLSVRNNELERITVEELKAMPKISGLDISKNPLNCDAEFTEAMEWLKSHGVTPTEAIKTMNLNGNNGYSAIESITSWSDLTKLVCEDDEDDVPAPKSSSPKPDLLFPIEITDEEAAEISKADLEADINKIKMLNHGKQLNDNFDDAWQELDKNVEYADYYNEKTIESYPTWYSTAMWSVLTVGFVTLGVLLIIIQFARFMASRRGRGPVIRPPLILRQGLVDNKNCGLVYKPLQEEIPTPQMPKKGSGYSRGPFHYKQIVPESS